MKLKLRDEIQEAINRHSAENGSNTPDFILASFLADCLDAFDRATNTRTEWYQPSQESKPAEGPKPCCEYGHGVIRCDDHAAPPPPAQDAPKEGR